MKYLACAVLVIASITIGATHANATCSTVRSLPEGQLSFLRKMAATGPSCYAMSVGSNITSFNSSAIAGTTGSYLVRIRENGTLIYNTVLTSQTYNSSRPLNTASNGNLTLEIQPIGHLPPYTAFVTRTVLDGYALISLDLHDATPSDIAEASAGSTPTPPTPPPGSGGECSPPANPALCY